MSQDELCLLSIHSDRTMVDHETMRDYLERKLGYNIGDLPIYDTILTARKKTEDEYLKLQNEMSRKDGSNMTNKDLTWDKIKELADMAVNSEQNFSLSIDADGCVSIDISTPTRTTTQSQMEFVPKTENKKSWPTPIPWKWGAGLFGG